MNGTVAAVTGSCRGLGQSLAGALAEADADVALNASRDSAELENGRKLIEGLGRSCIIIQVDVGQTEALNTP